MDEGSPPSGIESAAQEGIRGFEAEQFPDPVPAPPPAPFGPPDEPGMPGTPTNDLYSKPHFMQGGWYVSSDRISWWNGTMWILGRPPGSPHAHDASTPDSPTSPSPGVPLIVFLAGLAILAAIALTAWQAFQSMPTLTPPAP